MKKINHAYKYFNLDKFLLLLKDCKHTSTREFIMDIIIPSIDGYNSSDDEDGYFQMYLEELVNTGEFFVKLKKYFTINHFYENCIYEDGYWNAAFVLFCKKDKIHRLFNIAYERNGNDEVYVLDAISDSKIKKVNDLYHMKILDNHTKKIWKDAEKSWDEVYKEFDSPKYTRVKNFNYGKKFYEKHHSEGMQFEHKEKKPDEKTYDGELLDGKMHGLGTLIIKDKSKYSGEFKNNLYHGQGTFISNEGNKYVGEWKDGEMEGKGTFTSNEGDKYVGEWKDGKMDGKGTFTKPNGEQYVGEFKKGKKHGKGSYSFSFGEKYVGEYKNDVYDGQGTFTKSNGEKISGLFKDGTLLKGEWVDGNLKKD